MLVTESGESLVEYRITNDPHSGTWKGTLSHKGTTVGDYAQEWVEWADHKRVSEVEDVGTSTKTFESDQRTVITRQRFGQMTRNSTEVPDPAPGFMIWLEPR
jgi:hypothetical protein